MHILKLKNYCKNIFFLKSKLVGKEGSRIEIALVLYASVNVDIQHGGCRQCCAVSW